MPPGRRSALGLAEFVAGLVSIVDRDLFFQGRLTSGWLALCASSLCSAGGRLERRDGSVRSPRRFARARIVKLLGARERPQQTYDGAKPGVLQLPRGSSFTTATSSLRCARARLRASWHELSGPWRTRSRSPAKTGVNDSARPSAGFLSGRKDRHVDPSKARRQKNKTRLLLRSSSRRISIERPPCGRDWERGFGEQIALAVVGTGVEDGA